MLPNKPDSAHIGEEETVDPLPSPRLSRRNVLALVLTVVGVLLALFFSSRRSPSEAPPAPEPSYMGRAPIEIIPQTPAPWNAPRAREDRVDREARSRTDRRMARYEEALRSRPVIRSIQEDELEPAVPAPAKSNTLGAYTVAEGSVIEAALITGIDSDRPGPVMARIMRPVRDTADGSHVLIPAGTRLIGSMEEALDGQDRRVVLAWTRMLFPNGRTMDLPGLPAMEQSGEAGLRDRVRTHRMHAFGSAALIALLGGASAQAPGGGGIASATLALELSRVATGMIQKGQSRKPTATVRQGYRFLVYVSQDLVFDGPYDS